MNTNKPKVLFIDDEKNILNSLRRIFHDDNMTCYFTSSPDEAFKLIAEEDIWVIVSDQRMPVMEGVEVLKRAREIAPNCIRMMLTGYADIKSAMNAVNAGNIFRFLVKPWEESELKIAINDGIAQYHLIDENKKLNELTRKQNIELTQFNDDLEKTVEERTQEVRLLHSDIKKSFYSTIKLMGSLPGILDRHLDGQAQRVGKMAGFIATQMQMAESDVFDIQIAGYLHNIGALSDPTSGSRKKPLSRAAVKLGAQIVSMIPNLGSTPLYLRHQLERFDGRGSPDGLLGSKIPIGSRIISVCVEFDRLLYLGGLLHASPNNALEDIKSRSNAEFDPKVVKQLVFYVEKHLMNADSNFESVCSLVQLESGMVVSRAVLNKRGEVLVSKDITLSDEILESLWQRQMNGQPVGDVFIYSSSISKKNAA